MWNEWSCHVDSCQFVDEGMKKCNRQRGQVFQSNRKVKISDQKQIFLAFFTYFLDEGIEKYTYRDRSSTLQIFPP